MAIRTRYSKWPIMPWVSSVNIGISIQELMDNFNCAFASCDVDRLAFNSRMCVYLGARAKQQSNNLRIGLFACVMQRSETLGALAFNGCTFPQE